MTVLQGPCEAILNWESDRQGIYGVKCHRPGQLYNDLARPFGIILCDECYEAIKAKEVNRGR